MTIAAMVADERRRQKLAAAGFRIVHEAVALTPVAPEKRQARPVDRDDDRRIAEASMPGGGR